MAPVAAPGGTVNVICRSLTGAAPAMGAGRPPSVTVTSFGFSPKCAPWITMTAPGGPEVGVTRVMIGGFVTV